MRFVLRSDRHLADLRAALPRLLADLPSARVVTANLHPEHKAVLEGDTEVALTAQTLLPMRVGDVTLLLGPKSFFQTNTAVAGALYRQARDWVDDADPERRVGPLLRRGRFRPARHRPRSHGARRRDLGGGGRRGASARAMPVGRHPATGRPSSWATRRPPCSPPRPTSSSSTRRDVGSGPTSPAGSRRSPASTVVYSSCNVDSLARDLAAMPSLHPVTGRVFDMFPQTPHTEVMVRLERR